MKRKHTQCGKTSAGQTYSIGIRKKETKTPETDGTEKKTFRNKYKAKRQRAQMLQRNIESEYELRVRASEIRVKNNIGITLTHALTASPLLHSFVSAD